MRGLPPLAKADATRVRRWDALAWVPENRKLAATGATARSAFASASREALPDQEAFGTPKTS